ncbi:Scopoletin glucosyltransferase [Nymphaea thermarum]|nr:Scopoletin glucosyltransferase [Nymphaea thermarum]
MAENTVLTSNHEQHHHPPHILIFPFLAQGHMIPLVDMAILLSQRGLTVTLVATPLNLARISPAVDLQKDAGRDLQTVQLPFPSVHYGLPENCESLESVTSGDMVWKFFLSTRNLKEPFEKIMQETRPNCVISDFLLTWTSEVAHKFNIPRICFSGTCSFSSVLKCSVHERKPHEGVSSDYEPFLVSGLPHQIELTKAQMPEILDKWASGDQGETTKAFWANVANAEKDSDGIIVNSFYELEPSYVECYKKATGKPVWTVGPLLLCHENRQERGKKSSISEEECLEWLGSKKERSVLYISFGSINFISRLQMEEMKLGLKNLGCFFIWVVKELDDLQFIDSLEEKTRDKGLIIRGWAPQAVILSHPSIGAFLTHCGWNSTIEAISFGVPMLTWPLFAEQYLNEKLVVQILGIRVKVGSHMISEALGDEEAVGVVKSEAIEEAVQSVMWPGEEGEMLREKAWKAGDLARKAVEDQSGSSCRNFDDFIQFVTNKIRAVEISTAQKSELRARTFVRLKFQPPETPSAAPGLSCREAFTPTVAAILSAAPSHLCSAIASPLRHRLSAPPSPSQNCFVVWNANGEILVQ